MVREQECRRHGLTVYARRADGRFRCRKCSTAAVQKRRDVLKVKAVEYMGGKCYECGYNKCLGSLVFHHLDPAEKDFAISAKGYTRSWEKVKAELDKCILVCANCHGGIHEALDNDCVTT